MADKVNSNRQAVVGMVFMLVVYFLVVVSCSPATCKTLPPSLPQKLENEVTGCTAFHRPSLCMLYNYRNCNALRLLTGKTFLYSVRKTYPAGGWVCRVTISFVSPCFPQFSGFFATHCRIVATKTFVAGTFLSSLELITGMKRTFRTAIKLNAMIEASGCLSPKLAGHQMGKEDRIDA
jgi:hypothetical protein